MPLRPLGHLSSCFRNPEMVPATSRGGSPEPSSSAPAATQDPSVELLEERVGVEPTLDLRPNLISNQAPSATRPSLRIPLARAKVGVFIIGRCRRRQNPGHHPMVRPDEAVENEA